jgi:hypothetical protein
MKLTTVKLPAGVVSIDLYAFHNCTSLTTLYWYHTSNPTSINGNAFNGCPTAGIVHCNYENPTA